MLKINNLNLKLGSCEILKNINLHIESKKVTAIIGKNGSGKSSLIKCINSLFKYDGDIFYEGVNIKNIKYKEKAKKISVLPQMLKYPHILAMDIILMGLNPYLSLNKKIPEDKLEFVDKVLTKLNIHDIKNKYLDELSGGQRQIIYLAMQLVQNAELMIFDEPSSFMDTNYETQLLNIINEEKKEKSIIVAMHNINKVVKYADNIIILEEGRVIFSGSVEQCLNEEKIEKVFNLKKYEIEGNAFFE